MKIQITKTQKLKALCEMLNVEIDSQQMVKLSNGLRRVPFDSVRKLWYKFLGSDEDMTPEKAFNSVTEFYRLTLGSKFPYDYKAFNIKREIVRNKLEIKNNQTVKQKENKVVKAVEQLGVRNGKSFIRDLVLEVKKELKS